MKNIPTDKIEIRNYKILKKTLFIVLLNSAMIVYGVGSGIVQRQKIKDRQIEMKTQIDYLNIQQKKAQYLLKLFKTRK